MSLKSLKYSAYYYGSGFSDFPGFFSKLNSKLEFTEKNTAVFNILTNELNRLDKLSHND